MAILQSVDKQSYVAKVDDRIADAIIKSIDAQGVVFLETSRARRRAKAAGNSQIAASADEVNR